MCEWLSCGDWSDVQLLCKSRSFNAHRAVLASVSSFLKALLLSCPVDESPVFIFLPEFDDDTMPFVLDYIYNGEVLIPNQKLQMFLDTAKAMEIFIDQQHMPETNGNQQYCYETNSANNYNICQLTLFTGKNGCFVNIRKGMRTQQIVRSIQEPVGSLILNDNPIQTFRWSDENIPDLGNLTPISRYRQTQSYLRDIFIETYSQDGNVNGQIPRVLAISNEGYQIPKSVLLNNANGISAKARDTVLDTSYGTLPQNMHETSIYNYFKQLQDYKQSVGDNIKISYTVFDQFKANNSNVDATLIDISKKDNIIESWKNYTPLEIPLFSRKLSSRERRVEREFPEICERATILEDVDLMKGLKSNGAKSHHKVTKVTILNEVLQSPWHPRQPISYRPFRKKFLNSIHFEESLGNNANFNSMDRNKNSVNLVNTNLNLHDELISSEQDLKCSTRQEVFTRRRDYSVHIRHRSTVNRYSCGECQKTFSQLRNFKYHMSVHRGTKEFAATCSVCGKHFNDRGYLSNHMKIHRNRKEYKCASCPKSFNQRVAFNMHVRIHTGVKPHVCEECGKAFSRKMLLKQHQRTHSGERPYACAHCDKRFSDRSNMTLHLRLHTGMKPFSCTLCSKSFTKKHHLTSHMNFHTGAKPYSCPRCKLAFTQSSNMRTHFKKCNVTF